MYFFVITIQWRSLDGTVYTKTCTGEVDSFFYDSEQMRYDFALSEARKKFNARPEVATLLYNCSPNE